MPLLITPTTPFATSTAVPVPSLYAIITKVSYATRERVIFFQVTYYYHEQAYLDAAEPLRVVGLPVSFSKDATADEANAVPIFTFLEQVLTAQLTAMFGTDVTIENVT